MKKSRKKILLSSIAMLLVALVALGSATFAWFTVNKVVTVDKMKVQAVVADGLVITNKITHTAKSDWSAKVSFSDAAETLNAASMNVATVGTSTLSSTTDMYYPTDVKKDGAYDATGYENGPSASQFLSTKLVNKTAYAQNATLATAVNDYSAAYTFWVASSGEEAMTGKSITAAITQTSQSDGYKYIKAALCDSTGKVIGFYNDGGYKAVTAVTSGAPTISGTNAAAAKINDITALNNGSVPSYTADTTLEYTLYVWVEGNDADCNDTVSPLDANFTVQFTLAN